MEYGCEARIGKDSKLDCSQGKGGIPQGLWCYLCLAMNMLARTKNPVSLKVSIQIHLLRVRATINEYVLAIERLNHDLVATLTLSNNIAGKVPIGAG